MTTPSYEQLVALAEGRLPPEEQASVQVQVAADPAVAAEVVRLQHLFALMGSDDSMDAPAHVINRALRLMRSPVPPTAPSLRQRLVAALRFDSTQTPLAMGVRQEAAAGRSLLMSAGDYDLDLRVTPAGGTGWQVSGQVLGPEEEPGGQVELRGTAGSVTAMLNALQEFVLPPVPTGTYELVLYQAGLEIVVPGLELGSSPA